MKKKEKRKTRQKTPQNCKSPKKRQRFLTTVKNVTEEKKSSKAKLDFLVPIK